MKSLILVAVIAATASSLTGCAGSSQSLWSPFNCHQSQGSGCDACGGCEMSSYYPSEGEYTPTVTEGGMTPMPGPMPGPMPEMTAT